MSQRMNTYQELALHAYCMATWPLRRSLQANLAATGALPLCVLFYHRVADTCPNGWTISSREFLRQMNWLRRHRELVSMAEIQRRIALGTSDTPAVHVTFDDGYGENCSVAIPHLIAEQIPCTYFVSVDFVQKGLPFPHDVKSGHPLPPNTIDQLRAMAEAGIEIGAHTRTHADLGTVSDPAMVWDELVTARQDLAGLLGREVRYFAFPYGQRSNVPPSAIDIARKAGFQGVCTAQGRYNRPGSDPFVVHRIHGDPEFGRFRNWLTLDPRKLQEM